MRVQKLVSTHECSRMEHRQLQYCSGFCQKEDNKKQQYLIYFFIMMLSALSLSVISLSAGEHVRVSEVWSQQQTEAAGKPCSILVVTSIF